MLEEVKSHYHKEAQQLQAPINCPTQYAAWFLRVPATTADPNEQAGFMDPPVKGRVASTLAPAISPIIMSPMGPNGPRLGSLATWMVYTKPKDMIPSKMDAPFISSAIAWVGTWC